MALRNGENTIKMMFVSTVTGDLVRCGAQLMSRFIKSAERANKSCQRVARFTLGKHSV